MNFGAQKTRELDHTSDQTVAATSGLTAKVDQDEEVKLTSKFKNWKAVFSTKAFYAILVWYFFSLTTLVLNKVILSNGNQDPSIIASIQLLMCSFAGYIHLHAPCVRKKTKRENKPLRFYFIMLMIGSLRFITLFLGIVALWFVSVSFAETVKSTAPVFTVLFAWLVMREKTNILVCFTLIPIMGGLALCSFTELSFNVYGFLAALATNVSECLLNVASKYLISREKYSPPELQFYTSFASIGIQVIILIVMIDLQLLRAAYTTSFIVLLVLNGLSFHCQSITEYYLLTFLSPVTHSVANTAKRALLIWLSVIIFGNQVTFNGFVGTVIVILGVFWYTKVTQLVPPDTTTISFDGMPIPFIL